MAPPPEYDKEPKAPDKSVTTTCSDDSKVLYNTVEDQQANLDHKGSATTGSSDAENKHVETLDDGQLRALLDEAITYKCPKDREGKSSLFKELLHEVEQDEQACEAARGLSAGRAARRGARGRRELQSNSLQDLVAAMAAEPAPRRPRNHPPAQVSARAHHGGSLPSDVNTSFLLSEEPAATRGGYLATVRCVNPPPLAERRVSASDANGPASSADLDLLARRSKPTFPMTYTARATLEIGSGSVCSGRAVTTTTASNQVRTTPVTTPRHPRATRLHSAAPLPQSGQAKLMNAICPVKYDEKRIVDGGGIDYEDASRSRPKGNKNGVPRGQNQTNDCKNTRSRNTPLRNDSMNQQWVNSVQNWYEGLNEIQPFLSSFVSNTTSRVIENSVPTPSGINQIPNSPVRKVIAIENVNSSVQNISYADQMYFKTQRAQKQIPEILNQERHVYMDTENESILRKKYRERVGNDLVPPHSLPLNPHSFRKTTIGSPNASLLQPNKYSTNNANETNKNVTFQKFNDIEKKYSATIMSIEECKTLEPCRKSRENLNYATNKDGHDCSSKNDESSKSLVSENAKSCHLKLDSRNTCTRNITVRDDASLPKLSTSVDSDVECLEIKTESKTLTWENEVELNDIPPENIGNSNDFLQHLEVQQRFLRSLENEESHVCNEPESCLLHSFENLQNKIVPTDNKREEKIEPEINIINENPYSEPSSANKNIIELSAVNEDLIEVSTVNENMIELKENVNGTREKFIFAELPNNAYVFLTLPQSFLSLTQKSNNNVSVKEIENNNNITPYTSGANNVAKKSKKKNKHKKESNTSEKSATKANAVNKSALKLLLYSDSNDKPTPGMSLSCNKEVDSAIPFTCITTPEVVASCNTTSSTSSAVAVDPKPLQLGSCYRAVASLTGEWAPQTGAPRAASDAPPPDAASAPAPAPLSPAAPAGHHQPRSVISSNFNGLPLSRPNYGSTASTANDEYKKSLDENGNAVQGFSSPLSGSSQHKKPRRKKSSKNETVIKSHQIDGYQGNKDLNEVLRFIESNADSARGGKLGRAKHKDDSDDKGGKKRAAGRKDKESKMKRASSLEELSRTKLEDLTDEAPPAAWPETAPAKPERRSWGDAAGGAPRPLRAASPSPAPSPAAELTDFQTVTKRRKPRRRADDAAADPPRRARAPSPPEPRAPSDRSNDSNDDLDSVHSLPPDAPHEPPEPPRAPPAPHASYADIARTRHNIPDLIESCNFYAEGEAAVAPPADGDYPALAARRARDKPAAPPARARKEPEPPAPPPAPDVVADRRPPVVLLDSAARPRDMDGVTFGFDVNEQLLGAAPRRARCDLLRDAPDAPAAPAAPAAVPVRAGAAALRYVPPPPTPLSPHLVDYVGAAWEDVVRCGGSKVRYFSE